jgi:ectoine hydroxylase-related dioxygenase (phytanoyl-CoA dioxygenase family)
VSNFETDWHNDVFYTIPNSRFWQVWLPLLNDATYEIGTLIVCPGSHNHGIGKQRIDINANFNSRYTIHEESLLKYSPRSINVSLGDILIFDSRLIHKSGSNISQNRVRCTMLGSYHDALLNEFTPVSFEYKYNGKTPEGYFYELFGDEDAKKIMLDDLASIDLSFKAGV